MSSSSSSNFKTKKILKRNIKKGANEDIESDSKKIYDFQMKTPTKSLSRNLDEEKTVKKILPKLWEDNLSKSLDFYHSSNPYVLGQINSISFCNSHLK